MSATAVTFSEEEQKGFIKIQYFRSKKAIEIHRGLQEACGDNALSYRGVCRWVASFSAGRDSTKDEHRTGRPISITDKYHVEKVKELIDKDRRYTVEEIAQELDISEGSVHTILRMRLGMRKITSRWVPHMLTQEQKHMRVQISRQLLHRYKKEGDDFISRIVAIDETWLRSYEPELKSQSMEWHTPNSPRPAKFRRKQGNLKVMMIFAYDCEGIIISHHVPNGQTVNKEYYK